MFFKVEIFFPFCLQWLNDVFIQYFVVLRSADNFNIKLNLVCDGIDDCDNEKDESEETCGNPKPVACHGFQGGSIYLKILSKVFYIVIILVLSVFWYPIYSVLTVFVLMQQWSVMG